MSKQINITIDIEKIVKWLRLKLYKTAHSIGNTGPGYSRVTLWYKLKIRVHRTTSLVWRRKLTAWADWLGDVKVASAPTRREHDEAVEAIMREWKDPISGPANERNGTGWTRFGRKVN